MTTAVEIIRKKRDGKRLAAQEIEDFFRSYLAGGVADYQVSAWLMAALLSGLDESETAALTRVMRSLLFEVSSLDPSAFIAAAIAMAVIGAIAAVIPAAGATRVDPTTVLRSE